MSDHKYSTRRDTAGKTTAPALSFGSTPRKQPHPQRGSDPYNTSGSFDRKNNWTRVGKR